MAEKRKFKKTKPTQVPKKSKVAESSVIELKFGKGKELFVKSLKKLKGLKILTKKEEH